MQFTAHKRYVHYLSVVCAEDGHFSIDSSIIGSGSSC